MVAVGLPKRVQVAIALVVVTLGSCVLAVSPAAGQQAPPPWRLVVTDQSSLSLPTTLGRPSYDNLNSAGDFLFAAGNASGLFFRQAGSPTLTRLTQSGDPVPGLAGTSADIVLGAGMNGSGAAYFMVEYYMGQPYIYGAIIGYAGSNFRTIAASTDVAPDPSGSVYGRSPTPLGINSAGEVAFTAPLVALGSSAPAHRTIFVGAANGTVTRLAGYGDAAPGGGTLDQISATSYFGNRGEVLFSAAIVGGAGGYGLFVASPGGIRKVVAHGDTNPAGGTFDFSASAPSTRFLNDAGEVVFHTGGTIYLCSPTGTLSVAVSTATEVPVSIGGSLQTISAPSAFNEAGEIVFAATVTGSAVTTSALLKYSPGNPLAVVAYRNQAAPGLPGKQLLTFSSVRMNASGKVVFAAAMIGTGNGAFSWTAGDGLALVAGDGQSAPASVGGTYLQPTNVKVRDDGAVYFEATLVGSAADYGMFLVVSGTPSVLASTADPLPAGSRPRLRNLFLAGAGDYVGFWGRYGGGGSAMFLHNVRSGLTSRVAADGDAAPAPVGGRMALALTTSLVNLNANGMVLFSATVPGQSGTYAFLWDAGGGTRKLAGPGDVVSPGGETITSVTLSSGFLSPLINDAGQVAFRATISGGSGIFVATTGGSVQKLVKAGSGSFGDAAQTGGTFTSLGNWTINALGQVAFSATTSAGGNGIFVGEPSSSVSKVVFPGDAGPTGGVFNTSPKLAGFNSGGQVIFFGTLTGGPGGGLFMGTAGGSPQVVAENGSLAPAGGTYAFLSNSMDARINDLGDILFRAPLTGGTADTGMFLRRGLTGAVETVAVQGQQAPGAAGFIGTFPATINSYPGEYTALGPSGEAIVLGYIEAGSSSVITLFRYRTNGSLEKVISRGDPVPDSGGGIVASFSQGPGSGAAGRFCFRVAVVGGLTADSIATTIISTPGDYDGDSKTDLSVYRPAYGTWFWLESGSGNSAFGSRGWGVDAQGDQAAPGDYDGDGAIDPTVFRPGTGTWFILESHAGFTTWKWFGWGTATDTLVQGDYDGDGRTDAAVYRASSGTWYIRPSNGAPPWSVVFGQAGDVPIAGDFDGDGKPDPAVYRPASGTWFWLKSSTGFTAYEYRGWGVEAQGDVPAPGDFDGDGKTDLCVFRAGTGSWFILESHAGFTTWNWFGWGTVGDTIVPADYDGDGKTDAAVYRASSGTWYIRPSGGASPWSTVFGQSGDVPLITIQ